MNRHFLFLLGLMLCVPALWARPIDKEQAMQKAQRFYSDRGQTSKVRKLKQVPRAAEVNTAMENDCFYVFNAGEDDGYVIISGDDRTPDVLGYCDSGTFRADDMPENMKAWLDSYADQIRLLQQGDKEDDDPTVDRLGLRAAPAKLPTHAAVAPLMTSKWGQDSPYNNKCPVFFKESEYGRTVTGCVATAMAQIMYYHKHPAKTTQQIPAYTCDTNWKDFLKASSDSYIKVSAVPVTTFDWNNMLDTYDDSETATQKNAVATLMLACGASVKMNYGIDENGGSSASSWLLKDAFTTYFDYDKSMRRVSRADYTATEWDQLIYAEMAAGRPVCFSGQSTGGGHEFVIDGYDGSGYYHLNWGWGGWQDGYFLLGALTPSDNSGIGAGDGGYNAFQDAIIGIMPNRGGSNSTDDVLTTDSIGATVNEVFWRSNSSVGFQGVGVKASFWNRNGYQGSFDLGYGIYDINGNLKTVFTKWTNVSLQHQYGWFAYKCEKELNFGAGWADGKYRIMPVSRVSGTTQWKPNSGANTYYLLAVISGTKLELSVPSEEIDIDVASTNSPEVGGPADFKITIANHGADYIGHVLLYTPDLEDGKYISEELIELKAGETLTRTATVFFEEAGKYNVWLSLDDNEFKASTTVTVTAAKAHSLTCTYNVKNANSSTRIIDGDYMDMDITYTNTGNNTYDNVVNIWLAKKNADGSTYSWPVCLNDRLTLAAGAKVTRNYMFRDLEDGGVYCAKMFYMSGGDSKSDNNSYFYTIHHTSAPPAAKEAYAVVDGTTLTFYYDSNKSSRSGKKYAMNVGNDYPAWVVDSMSIKKAVFDTSFAGYQPVSTAHWFRHQVNLTSIQGISNLKTSATTTMRCMFYECYQLGSVDVSGFDTGNVTDMGWLFFGCNALKSINVKNFNTSKVTNMKSMFCNCSSLTSLDVSSFDTKNVTNMSYYFDDCSSLTSVNLSSFNTANVTDISFMFYGCGALQNINLKNFNTAKVIDFQAMFYECASLTSLDVSGFNTSNATDIGWMFYGCSALKSIDVSNFNTAKVTNMKSMFCYDSALTSLNLSSFNTSNVTDMPWMFYDCNALNTIYASNNFSTAKVTSSQYMFTNCTSLVGGMGTKYNENYTDKTYARIDGGTAAPGYFTQVSTSAKEAYAVVNGTTLTFYYDSNKSSRSGKKYAMNVDNDYPAWAVDSMSIKKAVFDTSFVGYQPVSTAHWFRHQVNLTSIQGISNLKTSATTTMRCMFYECYQLGSVDVSGFDTGNVTDMGWLFFGCNALKSINVKNFNTSKVTNMKSMFCNCSSLTSLDVSSFDTKNVTNMSYYFDDCLSLTSVNLSSFNTVKVTSMCSMFESCEKLTSLDLSNFNTANVTDMGWMFFKCSALKSLNVKSFNTAKVTIMQSMFYGCEALTSLDVTSFDTRNVTKMGWMFYGCKSLKNINLSNFRTPKVDDIQSLFEECSSLTSADLSSFNTQNVIYMGWMFYGCTSLTQANVSSFNTQNVTTMKCMFYDCENLTTLDVSGFRTFNLQDMAFMFRGCSKLEVLDLSGFTTGPVEYMNATFYGCTSLKTIYAGLDWATYNVDNSDWMFGNCYSLVGGAGTKYDPDHIRHEYARIDKGTSRPGYFTYKAPSVKGDVNGDGSVDVADIATIIDAMAGSGNVLLAMADVNGDGTIDVADIASVIDIMAANARRSKIANPL